LVIKQDALEGLSKDKNISIYIEITAKYGDLTSTDKSPSVDTFKVRLNFLKQAISSIKITPANENSGIYNFNYDYAYDLNGNQLEEVLIDSFNASAKYDNGEEFNANYS